MSTDLIGIIYELAIGCGVGFTIGLTGIGGGVLVVPALAIFLRLAPTAAVGTASAYIFLTNILASIQHARHGNIDFKLAHRFLAGAIPGNIIACLGLAWAKRNATTDPVAMAHMQAHLKTFIAGVMVFSIILMLANLLRELRPNDRTPPLEEPTAPSSGRAFLGLALGFLVGGVLGATSVGGGVVLVPLLIICFGLSARYTVGTSSYLALILMLCTALLSAGRGDVRWPIAAVMAGASLIGVMLGIRLGKLLPETVLRGAMIALMLVAVGAMLLM